jgi:hypothetical protein
VTPGRLPSYDGEDMDWDLWVDYHRTDGAGLTHANARHLPPGRTLTVGEYLVVGNEEADPAVAEVVSVDPDGILLVRVLPGPAEDHLHLTGRSKLHRAG